MVEKPYEWKDGAKLAEHSRRKHKILREYFARYLAVRCQLPQQARFRLAIIEGFAGGGRYANGEAGSPLIFVEELRTATEQFNLKRAAEGMSPLDIECLLVLNDEDPATIALLKSHIEPLLAAVKAEVPKLHIQVEYRSRPFEAGYPEIKQLLEKGNYRNVLFNLDQCGYSHVTRPTLSDITRSFTSAEIFHTFFISSLLAFLAKDDPQLFASQLSFLGLTPSNFGSSDGFMNNREWLGAAERLVFESFKSCAAFVSPFSINNPEGWRYWLMHFANNYRARQEYNNVLHRNSDMQAHFGRSGLNMLAFDPANHANALYLFDLTGRAEAKAQLSDDIPRLLTDFGDAVGVGEFYSSIYNATPAHMDDIHAAIMESPELEVITDAGGERRKASTISPTDTLRVKQQRTFFPIFFSGDQRK